MRKDARRKKKAKLAAQRNIHKKGPGEEHGVLWEVASDASGDRTTQKDEEKRMTH